MFQRIRSRRAFERYSATWLHVEVMMSIEISDSDCDHESIQTSDWDREEMLPERWSIG